MQCCGGGVAVFVGDMWFCGGFVVVLWWCCGGVVVVLLWSCVVVVVVVLWRCCKVWEVDFCCV